MAHPRPGEGIYNLAKRLHEGGARGLLISGGSDQSGKLPVYGVLDQVRRIKEDLGMYLSVHSGIVNCALASKLRTAGFDCVDYDLPPGEAAARLRGFKYRDYLEGLYASLEAGPPEVVPHVMLGLPGVSLEDETNAIDEVSSLGLSTLVLLVFIPTEGTPFESMPPPSSSRVLPAIRHARRVFGGEISLGCMRPPLLKRKLDPDALEEGLVDRIAVPRPAEVERRDLEAVAACCAIPKSSLSLFPRVRPSDPSLTK
ncbi:MAG TPA: hypothetical protein ENG69_05460 [Candidatus Korarchaeota archaeon]|nr:hypothetical protein [Candidatus Korarchaeota archaeon]